MCKGDLYRGCKCMIEPEINFIDRNEKEPVFEPEEEYDEEEDEEE